MVASRQNQMVASEILVQMGKSLRACSSLTLEWSLTIQSGKVLDDARFTCWVEAAGQPEANFFQVEHLLQEVSTPPSVLDVQRAASSSSVRQGVSIALSANGVEWRLYLHTRPPNSSKDEYHSYRWNDSGQYVRDTYHFYYASEIFAGLEPQALAHLIFQPMLQQLIKHERWQQMSGFWVRYRGDKILQVDLIYPWHPVLSEFEEQLKTACTLLNAPTNWINEYNSHHLRHIAFSGIDKEPACTLYFSAPTRNEWPKSLDELKAQVQTAAHDIHQTLENEYFAHVPPRAFHPNIDE